MISFVIDTICEGFIGESTDEKVQLQIIKALQAALTNVDPAYSLHGAILLKVIRTTYNIFLLSKSVHVQMVAQGTVTQMIQNVLGRIPQKTESSPTKKDSPKDESADTSKTSLKQADADEIESQYNREVKDAFKVLRTICILSMKPLPATEG